jgi:hypothetical protein
MVPDDEDDCAVLLTQVSSVAASDASLCCLAVNVLNILVPAPGRWGAIGCENQHRHRLIKTQGVCIRDFVVCLLERTGVSSQAVVLSLLYAKRIVAAGVVPRSPQRLFLGSLMMACKVRPSRSLWP